MDERGVNTSLFPVYDMPMRYVADSLLLMDPIDKLMSHFRHNAIRVSAALTVCFRAVRTREAIPLMLSSSACRLSAGTGIGGGDQAGTGLPYEVIRDEGRLIADFPEGGVLVMNGQAGWVDGYLIQPETMAVSLIEYLFYLAFTELLRHRGLYMVHAAALENQGRGILIPGKSGCGKTISFISLLRLGYRYLSDDHPLIRDVGAYVEVFPLPTRLTQRQARSLFSWNPSRLLISLLMPVRPNGLFRPRICIPPQWERVVG